MELFTEPHTGICACVQHQEVMVYCAGTSNFDITQEDNNMSVMIMCAKPDYIMAAADGIVIRDSRIIATDYPKIQKKGNILISYCGLNEVREKGQFRYMKDVIKEIIDSFPENGTGYDLVQTVEKRLWQDLKYSNTDGTIHLFIASLENSPLSYQKERLLYALEIRKDSVWKQRFINDQSIHHILYFYNYSYILLYDVGLIRLVNCFCS